MQLRRNRLCTILCTVLLSLMVLSFRSDPDKEPGEVAAEAAVQAQLMQIRGKLQGLQPKGRHIVIDTVRNRLYLKEGDRLLLEAVCSTGSGEELVWEQQRWKFETPRGRFRIISRVRNPLWRKPDWAYLEQREEVPLNDGERFERDALGEWALGFGDGYFIHGTEYTRLLGESVTHGCVRLGARDLSALAKIVRVGDPVYIF